MKREPIFAKQGWYPAKEKALKETLNSYFKTQDAPVPAYGVLAPHAGYSFSGAIAGSAYSQIEPPTRAVIFAVNHRGFPNVPDLSLWSGEEWRTPIGDIAIDVELRDALSNYDIFTLDEDAHHSEHSAELQMPFLLHLNPAIKINVICISGRCKLDILLRAGTAVANASKKLGAPVLVVGSGDFSHEKMQTAEYNRKQDEASFPYIENIDPDGFHNIVLEKNISTCGLGTFTATLAACREMGAQKATLADYGSSARDKDIQDYVVSYASFVIR